MAPTPPRQTGPGAADLLAGLLLPLRGAVALVRTPGALGPSLAPILLTAAAMALAGAAMAGLGDRLAALLWSPPTQCTGCGLLARAWSWATVAAWEAYRWLLVLVATVAAGLVASRVVGSPFMDVLARRVLRANGVGPAPGAEADLPLARWLLRTAGEALLRAVLLAAGWGALLALSLIPGVGVVTGPLGAAWSVAWLFIDTMAYPMQWVGGTRVADMTELARRRPALCTGFAIATGLLMLVPLAGLLATPAAVAGACLLLERAGRPAPAPAAVPAA